jgi:5'-3' exonuclease
VLSGKRNFREDLYPEYKANRASAPKPKYYSDIRDYLYRNYGAVITNGIEADDELGIRAAKLAKEGHPYIVASTDKDLKQIPGEHYDFVEKETWTVSAKDSVTMFYQQLLSGDSTDNIPGITGVGPVKAAKHLADCTSPKIMAETVYKAYQEFTGLECPDHIIDLNARLLWIFRKKGDSHPFWRHMGREAT